MKKILASLLVLNTAIVLADNLPICSPNESQPEIKQSVKWYRTSAERNALYHQAYDLADSYVVNWVNKTQPKARTWGVVLDIDETTLDNSWYFRDCTDLADDENDFSHYVANPQKSVALPGVIKFINHVHQLGGYVSLVSNRDGSFKDSSGSVIDSTMANLKQQGVYFDQVVLANRKASKTPSNKNPRFNAINSGKYDSQEMVWSNKLPEHNVIAYVGDNIQDFPNFKQSEQDKLDANDNSYEIFGHGNFILPNPMYGSWGGNQVK